MDGFNRGLRWSELAFPFSRIVDWKRVAVTASVEDVLNGRLLLKLVMLRQTRAVDARLRYLRQISHHLVFDRRPGEPDASDAALLEIVERVRQSRGAPAGKWSTV